VIKINKKSQTKWRSIIYKLLIKEVIDMGILIYILLFLVISILFFYSFFKVADDADKRSEKIFKEWWDNNNDNEK
jgi:preprotein translocase subunit SecY